MQSQHYDILVIDDSSRQYQLIEATLLTARLASFSVNWAPTYETGLDALRNNTVDLCLIDYNLGDRSGIDLIIEAKKKGYDTPFILITAEGNSEIDQAALDAGAVDYLDKGNLTPELLERTIRYAVRGRDDARALRDSEQRYRHLLSTVPAGIFIYQDERITYANEMFGVLTYYTMEQLRGMDLLEMIDPEYKALVSRWINTGYQPSQTEIPFYTRTGQLRWFSLTTSQTDFNGKPATLGAIINVTRRKQIEQALWESEKRFRALVEYSTDRITQLASDGTILYTSPSTERILGYTEAECMNRSYFEYIHPDDRDEFEQKLSELVEKQQAFITLRYREKHKDGHYCWMESIASNLLHEEPVNSLVINSRDITENMLAMESEREQRAHAEALGDVAVALNSTLKLDEVLERILANVGAVIPHDEANIMLIEDNKTHIVGYRGRYLDDNARERKLRDTPHFNVDETQTFKTMRDTNQPVIVPDVQRYEGWLNPSATSRIRAFMGAPISINGEVIGFLNLDSHTPNFFNEDDVVKLRDFAMHSAIAIQNARAYSQAQELATIEERQRLARDLHDAVSQTLFSASMIAETLPRLLENENERIEQGLHKLARMTRGALAEMRSLLVELRPHTVVSTELGILLEHLVNSMRGRTDGDYTLTITGDSHLLPPEAQVTFYRVTQESLNNIFKYARAEKVNVTLNFAPDCVELTIADDGVGFDPSTVGANHHGLRIMQERAQSISAQLTVESTINTGTHIKLIWKQETAVHDDES